MNINRPQLRNLDRIRNMRKKILSGCIVEISVHNMFYSYAQVLKYGYWAYFEGKYNTPLNHIESVIKNEVLFIINTSCVDSIKNGRWKIVNRLPIDSKFEVLPMQYVYDSELKRYAIYNPNTGELTQNIYTKDDVLGLECCAVWYDNHIEDRLFAYYERKECPWLKICGKIE